MNAFERREVERELRVRKAQWEAAAYARGEAAARAEFDALLQRFHRLKELNGSGAMFKAQWDEAKHKRGDHGKFARTAGGGASSAPTAKPTPEPAAENPPPKLDASDFSSQESFGAAMFSALNVPGLSDEVRGKRKATAESVASRLPPKALDRLSRSLSRVVGHLGIKSVTNAWAEGKETDDVVLGFMDRARQELHIDGGLTPDQSGVDELGGHQDISRGVYAHEIGHAIDSEGGRWDLSFDPRFLTAFVDEIEGGQLSDYAATNLQEGFAEFARLLYGTDIPHDTIEEKFPKTFAFFKDQGLI